MWLVDLNYNLECDWLIELSNNKLTDNNLACELVENRSFFSITTEEIVIFFIMWKTCFRRVCELTFGLTNNLQQNRSCESFKLRIVVNFRESTRRSSNQRWKTSQQMLKFTWNTVRFLKPGHPDNENQSDGRTETIDSNIFKSSLSNVRTKQLNFDLFVMILATTVPVNKLSNG